MYFTIKITLCYNNVIIFLVTEAIPRTCVVRGWTCVKWIIRVIGFMYQNKQYFNCIVLYVIPNFLSFPCSYFTGIWQPVLFIPLKDILNCRNVTSCRVGFLYSFSVTMLPCLISLTFLTHEYSGYLVQQETAWVIFRMAKFRWLNW